MPYKDPEKRRANTRDYREKNKEKITAYREKNKEEINRKSREYYQKNIEESRRRNNDYRATHKEEIVAYREENKEEINRKNRERYQKNPEPIIQRTRRYHFEHKEWREKYYSEKYQKIRLDVLARIDPAMKCAMCGCNDTRFLEVNHIKGGGNKEHKNPKVTRNMILLIHNGKRGVEDLNLLCRACNSLDHLERVYGKTGLSVVWDKKED